MLTCLTEVVDFFLEKFTSYGFQGIYELYVNILAKPL